MKKRWVGLVVVVLALVFDVAIARDADDAGHHDSEPARASVLASLRQGLQSEQWGEIHTLPDGSVQEVSYDAGKGMRFSGIKDLPYPELFRSSVDGSVYAGADGNWFEVPSLSPLMALFEPDAMLSRLERDIGNVQALPEMADVDAARFRYTVVADGEDARNAPTFELWVSNETGLPIRMLSTSAAGSSSADQVTVIRYEYDPEALRQRFVGVPGSGQ